MASQESKLKSGAELFLDDGEHPITAIVVARRGHTKSAVSASVPMSPSMGGREQQRAQQAAGQAEVKIESPMGVLLTNKRLLLLKIGAPIGLGIGGKVKEVLTALSLDEVDSIEVKRIAMRQNIELTIRSVAIELEANGTASAKELAEQFERLKVGTTDGSADAPAST